jgi:hypothetical protein
MTRQARPQPSPTPSNKRLRLLGAAYLLLQGLGALAWWSALLIAPKSRAWFMAQGAPDSTLLQFAVPDLGLFAGASLLVSYGLVRERSWAWPLLLVHAGAASYAALCCLTLASLDSTAWLAAALMLPPLLIPSSLAYALRPGKGRPSC